MFIIFTFEQVVRQTDKNFWANIITTFKIQLRQLRGKKGKEGQGGKDAIEECVLSPW